MELRILEAAAQEIELHGSSFRMDDLARRLNISKRTLYENFRSKNEIIEKILTAKLQSIYDQHRILLMDDKLSLEDKLKAFFAVESRVFNSLNGQHFRELFDKMPFLIDNVIKLGDGDWEQLRTFLLQEQKKGIIRAGDINVLIMMLQGMVGCFLYDPKKKLDDVQASLSKAVQIVLHGIISKEEES